MDGLTAQDKKAPATVGLLSGVVDALHKGILAAFKKRDERIAKLESRIDEAERKGFGIRYAGVWKPGKHYTEGQFATFQGGLWHCNADTDTRPGTGPHWTLAVKSGERA
ncbi:MAG: hypothetical protein ACXIUZ_01600 [Lysobacteraceae bacterium]